MVILTDRALNRATLARQMLLDRSALAPADAVGVLLGLQAQQTHDPYIALWSRLTGFRHDDLTALILDKTLNRATTMRGTLHLHTAADLVGIRALVRPYLVATWKSGFRKRFGDTDADAVLTAAVALIDRGPTTAGDLGKALAGQFPSAEPLSMTTLLQSHETLVQVPPTRIWGSGHAPLLMRLAKWLPAAPAPDLDRRTLVRRYLAAFGPASVADIQAWSRLTRIKDDIAAIEQDLVVFEGEDGRRLYDLPEAPRPDAATLAPVRFLPLYDNVYLGYDDRQRMLSPASARLVNMFQAFRPAVLIDGQINAGWSITPAKGEATLEVTPYRKLTRIERRDLEAEGLDFVRFLEPAADRHAMRVLDPVAA